MKRTILAVVLSSVTTAVVMTGVQSLVWPPTADAQGRAVRTEQLELVGPNGKTRVIIGPLGQPGQANEGGFGMIQYDANGARRLTVGILPDGSPYISQFDSQNRMRLDASIWDAATGKAALTLYDSAGNRRAALAMTDTDATSFTLMDSAGRPRVMNLVTNDGSPISVLFDAQGTGLWTAP